MSPIYEIDRTKYKNISFDKALSLKSSLVKEYHTCSALMEKKRELERVVRRCQNFELKKHFRTPFQKRKVDFYQKVIYEILVDYNQNKQLTDWENKAVELTKDILFIYSVKKEEIDSLEDMLEHMSAEIDHQQEMMESLVEEWRGVD